jgi:anti-sigma B factor antagonist
MNPGSARHDASLDLVDFQPRPRQLVEPAVAVRVHRSGRWLVLEVDGEMDLQVVPLIPDLVGSDASRAVFELHGVTFMDASGLGAIAETQRQAVAAGGCVRLVAPSTQARRLLMLAGSERAFPSFDSVEAAMSTPFDSPGDPAG